MKQLVTEFYTISDHEVKKLAESRNPYWMKVKDFWWQIKDEPVDSLTQAQANWLSNIETELTENWRPRWMREDYEKERKLADSYLD